jgi:hypothetical protein
MQISEVWETFTTCFRLDTKAQICKARDRSRRSPELHLVARPGESTINAASTSVDTHGRIPGSTINNPIGERGTCDAGLAIVSMLALNAPVSVATEELPTFDETAPASPAPNLPRRARLRGGCRAEPRRRAATEG